MSRFYDLMIGSVRALAADAASFPAGHDAGAPPERIKLDANESPYGPSPLAVAAMMAILEGSHFYPDNLADELRDKLAEKHGVERSQILVAPGSTGVISVVARTMLEPGLNAITSERSFLVYRYATHAAGGRLAEIPMREDTFDLEAILGAIDDHTRVIFLANPNNPTGTFLPASEIDTFLARVPSHVVVVLDEAYYDYARYFAENRKIEHPRSMDYVRDARNVVVLRTFSKAHGLAGLRIGYGIGPAELMGYFSNMQDTFAVSTVAQAAALAALDDNSHVKSAVEKNARQAEWLHGELSRMGCRALRPWANFLYCDFGPDAERVGRALHQEGIAVRPLGTWGAPTAIRISVGTPEQNNNLLSVLGKLSSRRTSS